MHVDRKIRPEWTCSFTAYFTVVVFLYHPTASTNQTVSPYLFLTQTSCCWPLASFAYTLFSWNWFPQTSRLLCWVKFTSIGVILGGTRSTLPALFKVEVLYCHFWKRHLFFSHNLPQSDLRPQLGFATESVAVPHFLDESYSPVYIHFKK